MYKAVLFGGTTEGRELADFLLDEGIPSLLCVASEYGGSLVKESGSLSVHVGRLDESEIEKLLKEETPEYVIDATHPYAAVVSGNISAASAALKIPCLRVKRRRLDTQGCAEFEDIESLVNSLDETEGAVFLTTGSKDLKRFSRIKNAGERLFARVLPSAESIELCLAAGMQPSHIICMQGPFSKEINLAMFRETKAKILVTKESGASGGFDEKLSAAKELKMKVFLLKRPPDEGEASVEDVKRIIGGK